MYVTELLTEAVSLSLQYYVTSYGGQLKSELDCRYLVNKEHEHWDVSDGVALLYIYA